MIYRLLLEDDFERLPVALRVFHAAPGHRTATGSLSIRRQNAFLAWLVGFPPEGDDVPVRLDVMATEDEEIWTRRFADVIRSSTQTRLGGLLLERAGPLRVAFQIRTCEGGMTFQSRWACVWRIPIPLRVEAAVRGGDVSWEVEVQIAHIGSYRGAMTPKL